MRQQYQTLTRAVLFGEDAEPVRRQFLEKYESDVREFIENMATSFEAWEALCPRIEKDVNGAHLSSLVYQALHNHVLSMKLLLEGLMVAAGNAQRFVLESMAMAFLASNCSLGYLERYSLSQYSTSKSIRDLRRNAKKLGVLKDGVSQLEEHSRFYDQYSHPTLLSAASLMTLNGPHSETVFGSVFDPAKKAGYDKEIRSRVSLASVFPNFIQGIRENYEGAA